MQQVVGFWRRCGAFVIDLLIINFIIAYPFRGIFLKYFGKFSISGMNSAQAVPSNVYWALFFISVLALFYFTFFEYYLGQTPGQRLLRIKSISLKEPDGHIGIWTAILRNCFILPFFPFYVFWIVDPLYFAFYKERFLEKISATSTVYETMPKGYKSRGYQQEYKLEKVK